jgi:hypothetical protein
MPVKFRTGRTQAKMLTELERALQDEGAPPLSNGTVRILQQLLHKNRNGYQAEQTESDYVEARPRRRPMDRVHIEKELLRLDFENQQMQ